MAPKSEVLASITKTSYGKNEVIDLIKSVATKKCLPLEVKVGDTYITNVGAKLRPVIVFQIIGDIAYGLACSTTEDSMNLTECQKSRFASNTEGQIWFSKGVVVSKVEHVRENYEFSYEHLDCLQNAVQKQIDLLLEITL